MTTVGRKIKLLEQVPLFSACTGKELAKIARLAERISADAGQTLTAEGDAGRQFFVIEEGTADVVAGGKKLATLGPGEFFGEMALLDQSPRVATVRATTPMTLYAISAKDFGRLIDEVPFVGKKLLRGLATRLRMVERAPTYSWNR